MGRKKNKRQQSGLDELFEDLFDAAEDNSDEEDNEKGNKPENAPVDSRLEIELHPAFIEPDPEQPRKEFDDDAIQELADSIKTLGLIQPLVVRPLGNGTYRLVAGERRWRAARLAKLESVPVIIRELSDSQAALVALVENLQREDLNPVEEANGYRSLMDKYDMSQTQIAEAVGKPRSTVSNSLRLLTLGDYAREAVGRGELSTGHAKLLAGLDEQKQKELTDAIIEQQLSVRELEKMIAQKQQQEQPAPKGRAAARIKKPQFLTEAELALKQTFGQPVKITQARNGRTKLTIECKSDEEFRELLKKLGE